MSVDTRNMPTVATMRSIQGTINNTSHRHVAWSADGQCILATQRAIVIATPHLTSTRPAPANLIATTVRDDLLGPRGTMKSGRAEADDNDNEADDDEEEDVVMGTEANTDEDRVGESSAVAGRRMRRPDNGEVRWWYADVAQVKGKAREEENFWVDVVGDELNQIIIERERSVRSAVWSPSGLNDLGGCLLVVMSNVPQVSVYAPGLDPYTTDFVEVADLTRATSSLLTNSEGIDGAPSTEGMFKLRATAMEWSGALPLPSMLGIDGSLLALANRAGDVDLWRFGTDRIFQREGSMAIPSPWVADLTWSTWRSIDADSCIAHLALAATDGSISILPVRRIAKHIQSGPRWELALDKIRPVSPADQRAVTAIRWITADLLVWAKSGSVHLYSLTSGTVKSVRLEKIGNWPGTNALGTCVGMHLVEPDSLLVVLSSLTHHLIVDIFTAPRLAPTLHALRLSLAAHDIFVDCLYSSHEPRPSEESELTEYTAHTAGWAAIGSSGDMVSWLAEPVTFHDLNTAIDSFRSVEFVVADLKANPSNGLELVGDIQKILDVPPNLLHESPLSVLMPHALRILTSTQPHSTAEPLLELVSSHHVAVDLKEMESVPEEGDLRRGLMRALWGVASLDTLRLRFVLAQWGQRTFPKMTTGFEAAARSCERAIQRALATAHLRWAEKVTHTGRLDAQYLGCLQAAASEEGLGSGPAIEGGSDTCPACGEDVDYDSEISTCLKGHEWARCSVSYLLITTPEYRLCTVCPAVALMPRSSSTRATGTATSESVLVKLALEAAVACPTCGGRWARAL